MSLFDNVSMLEEEDGTFSFVNLRTGDKIQASIQDVIMWDSLIELKQIRLSFERREQNEHNKKMNLFRTGPP